MSSCQVEFDRLRAPVEDRTALIEPPFDQIRDLVTENLCRRDQFDCDLHGRSLTELSQLARTNLMSAARRWTSAYRNVAAQPTDPVGLIYVAGHQPQMFHPGVWLKNFALGALAEEHGATAINLVIDNDILAEASLSVPSGTAEDPHVVKIPFDRPDARVPHEERRIEDRALFESFDRRVEDAIASLVPNPLIGQYWQLVQARSKETDNLGACLAQARHQLEGSWGLGTLEVPQSRVCEGEAFQWFVAHLLADLPEFREVHNQAVREYRLAHHIRSTSHPVPELAEEGSWLEAPLWVWTADESRRRRLFARSLGNEIALSDRQAWETRLPLRRDGDAGRAVDRLLQLQRDGVRIRSRALVTTLWARLALGDLFIHGIGGAKYDQVTNALMERFFRVRPPCFMVVSATLHLPIERHRATPADARAIDQELRNLTYHPERYLNGSDASPRELIDAKSQWIATPQTKENARKRCCAIRAINAALQPPLEERRRQLLEQQTPILRRLKAESVLARRDYAFCLYPEATLRKFLSQLLPKSA